MLGESINAGWWSPRNWTKQSFWVDTKPALHAGKSALGAMQPLWGTLVLPTPTLCSGPLWIVPELGALRHGCWQAHVLEETGVWGILGCSDMCWKDVRLQVEVKSETSVSCREQREKAEILRLRSQTVGNKREWFIGGQEEGETALEPWSEKEQKLVTSKKNDFVRQHESRVDTCFDLLAKPLWMDLGLGLFWKKALAPDEESPQYGWTAWDIIKTVKVHSGGVSPFPLSFYSLQGLLALYLICLVAREIPCRNWRHLCVLEAKPWNQLSWSLLSSSLF